jgi:DNA modification methylase
MEMEILYEDSRNGLLKFESNTIDLTVTSPPYKIEDGYSDQLIIDVFTEVYRLHKDKSVLFVNFGHLNDFKTRPFKVVELIESVGFKLKDTIIWIKNHYKPIQGNKTLNNKWEYVFLFIKNKIPEMDRLAIGIPFVCKSNIGRFAKEDLHCGGNLWYIPYETITKSSEKLHNDRFPIGLPLNCLKLYPFAQDILDPFSGSGTTCLAAKMENRKSFKGCELNDKYKIIVDQRIKEYELKTKSVF